MARRPSAKTRKIMKANIEYLEYMTGLAFTEQQFEVLLREFKIPLDLGWDTAEREIFQGHIAKKFTGRDWPVNMDRDKDLSFVRDLVAGYKAFCGIQDEPAPMMAGVGPGSPMVASRGRRAED